MLGHLSWSPDFVEAAVDLYNYERFTKPRLARERKQLLKQIKELNVSEAFDQLREFSNHFQIEYQHFKEHNKQHWLVTNRNTGLKGQGETLSEAVHDLLKQRDFEEFRQALQHASIGNKTVQEWKDKLREIL